MSARRWIALPLLAAAILGGNYSGPVRAKARYRPPPVVIAIVEVGDGLNVFHSDFDVARGQGLPQAPGMPETRPLPLPDAKTFDGALSAAEKTFGRLEGGELYSVRGTRIVGIYAEKNSYSILEDRDHGTGTSSSALGLTHGTAPNALLVFVPDTGRRAWEWVARQPWIDVVSSSYFTVVSGSNCPEVESIRRLAERGKMVFTAAGNQDAGWTVSSPSGVPEAYQVGGVDSEGRTKTPMAEYDLEHPASVTDNSTRPYETGDAFTRPVADAGALRGTEISSGTSYSAPATAGRAAALIEHARAVLRTPQQWDRKYLAVLGPGGTRPAQGPLADGDLTRDELTDLLHHTAAPAEAPSPGRYLLEGYGAHTDETVELAKAVLDGSVEEPQRPEEDAMNAQVEAARAHFFPEDRCS